MRRGNGGRLVRNRRREVCDIVRSGELVAVLVNGLREIGGEEAQVIFAKLFRSAVFLSLASLSASPLLFGNPPTSCNLISSTNNIFSNLRCGILRLCHGRPRGRRI